MRLHKPPDKPDETENPCPICVHLKRWHGNGRVQKVTHGAGGPDGEWWACYEHYKVISAYIWLKLTHGFVRADSQ